MEIAKCVIIVILSAATVICAAGWLLYRISFTALAKYICDKGYNVTDKDLKSCCAYVWRRIFHIK